MAEAEKRLVAVTRKRVAAEGRVDELRRQTHELIVEGYGAGVPKLRLAQASGLTRQTIYSVLLRAGVLSDAL